MVASDCAARQRGRSRDPPAWGQRDRCRGRCGLRDRGGVPGGGKHRRWRLHGDPPRRRPAADDGLPRNRAVGGRGTCTSTRTGKLTDKSVVRTARVRRAWSGRVQEALAKYGTMSLCQVMVPAIRYAEEGDYRRQLALEFVSPQPEALGDFGGGAMFLPAAPRRARLSLKQPTLRGPSGDRGAGPQPRSTKDPSPQAWTGSSGSAGGSSRWPTSSATSRLAGARAVHLSRILAAHDAAVVVRWRDDYGDAEHPRGLPRASPLRERRWAHLLGSAYQRAFVDRNEKLADPAFGEVHITDEPNQVQNHGGGVAAAVLLSPGPRPTPSRPASSRPPARR